MAAWGEDKWLKEFPKHPIFKRMREKLGSEATPSNKQHSKNLSFCLGGDFFVWDDVDRAFYTTNLRQLNSNDGESSAKFQKLICINPPLFEVYVVLLNPTESLVALVGQKGVSVLELPRRWGKKSQFEGGREEINCNTMPVGQRFFTCSPSIVLRQAAWFPSETEDPHLVILTSDNTIRLYSLRSPLSAAKILRVSQSEDDSNISTSKSYAASLGEIAVAFDIGPDCPAPQKLAARFSKDHTVYPLYILYENGETYLSYMSLAFEGTLSKPAGPLPMYPAAEDNYGYDACAILCLPSTPNILVIATETGILYHCAVMQSEEEEEAGSNELWERETGSSLYVFECVELELTLKVVPKESEQLDFTCPIRLHSDPLCEQRYHCTHEAGVHTVGLPWLSKLQKFLLGNEDEVVLQEIVMNSRCIVEHIVCTRPLSTNKCSPIRSFFILSDLSLGPAMICLTSTYECIVLPLLCGIHPRPPPLLCSLPSSVFTNSPLRGLAEESFEQHIRNILARSATNPLIMKAGDKEASPPASECLRLLSRATQVFREEYMFKQDLACEEIQRRVKLLKGQKSKQLEELNGCKEQKRHLREMAEKLADKYEDAKYRQESIMKRVKKVLVSFQNQMPVLSNSEKEMKKEVESISKQLKHLDERITEVKLKTEYQKTHIDNSTPRSDKTFWLNDQQKKVVRDVLGEQAQEISEMMKQIKEVKSQFSF